MNHKSPQIFNLAEIRKKRRYIHSQLNKHGLSSSLKEWNSAHLQRMYELYDHEFFGNEISEKIASSGSTLKFQTTSGTSAKIGGWCRTQKLTPQKKTCTFTISFPRGLYMKLFTDPKVKTLKSNGLNCHDRLECLQLTFEHEFVHLIMELYGQYRNIQGKGKMIYSSHGKLFQCFVKAYFGHTDFRHSLLSGDASTKLTPSRVKIGMAVKFKGKKGEYITGTVTKINKKTVGVSNVYRVPYTLLESNDGVTDGAKPPPKPRVKTPPTKIKRVILRVLDGDKWGTYTTKQIYTKVKELDTSIVMTFAAFKKILTEVTRAERR